jgi:diguanylate cyclase (GGDEF)-like protein
MTVWLRRLSIGALVLALLIALVYGIVREVQVKRMAREEQAAAATAQNLASLSTLRYHSAQMRAVEAAYALTGDAGFFEAYKKSRDVVKWELGMLKSRASISPALASQYPKIEARVGELMAHASKLVDLRERTDFATAGSFAAEQIAKRAGDDFVGLLYRAEIDLQGELERQRKQFAGSAGESVPFADVFKVLAILLGFLGVALAVAPGALAPREVNQKLLLESQDNVTRLPTRQYFRLALERAKGYAGKEGTHYGVLLFDIVSFRKVNERFGYDSGDQLLRKLADRTLRLIRQGDTVTRMPGDEFALLVFRDTRQELDTFIDTLQAELGRPCRLGDEAVRVNVCIAAGFFPEDGQDPEKLMDIAAERLNRAQKTAKRGIKVLRRKEGQNTSEMEEGPISSAEETGIAVPRPVSPVAAGVASAVAAAEVPPEPAVIGPAKAFPGVAELLAEAREESHQATVKLDTSLLSASASVPVNDAATAASDDIRAIYEAELRRYLGVGAGSASEEPAPAVDPAPRASAEGAASGAEPAAPTAIPPSVAPAQIAEPTVGTPVVAVDQAAEPTPGFDPEKTVLLPRQHPTDPPSMTAGDYEVINLPPLELGARASP